MKLAAKALLLLITLAAVFAVAQIQPGTFKHIIIVVQENPTPTLQSILPNPRAGRMLITEVLMCKTAGAGLAARRQRLTRSDSGGVE